ncbi:nuclear mitotic apparatus protein 1-like [Physella acuta]|uniref:nuclear mitotic apparatus protein 1-like n=1 Tax=Physella acuta TaxID=109671 RepID=UPI0027DAF28F|nr:nuclear mitotic apparatus protein 1-like [Physella acuta]
MSKKKMKNLKQQINGLREEVASIRNDCDNRETKFNELFEKYQLQEELLTEIFADVSNLSQIVRESNEFHRLHGADISSQETDFQNNLNGEAEIIQRLESLEQKLPTISSTQTEIENIREVCDELVEKIRHQEETTSELRANWSEYERCNEYETRASNSDDFDNIMFDVEKIKEENGARDNQISDLCENSAAADARLEDLCGRTKVLESSSNDFQVRMQQAEGGIKDNSDALDDLTDRQDKVDQRLQADLTKHETIRKWQEEITDRLETDLTRLEKIRGWQDSIDDRLETDRTRLEEIKCWQDRIDDKQEKDLTRLEETRGWQDRIEDRLETDLTKQEEIRVWQGRIEDRLEEYDTRLEEIREWQDRIDNRLEADGTSLEEIRVWQDNIDDRLATDQTRLVEIRQWQQRIEDRLDADLNHQDNVNTTQNVILTQVQRLDQSLFGIGENLSTQLQQLKTKLKHVAKKGLARGKILHNLASFSKKLLHTYRIMFSRVIDLDSQVQKAAELSEKEISLLEQRVVKAEDKYLYIQSASKDTQTELSPIGFTAAPRGLASTVVRRGDVVQNFTDVSYNKGGYFNPSTGAFTAPVAGLYYTSLTMSKMNQGRIDLHVKHRPENSGRGDRPVKIVCRAHSGQDETSSTGAGLCYLETGDSLYVVAVTVSQDAVLNCYSSFSCFLVS